MQHPLPPQPPGPDRVAILKFDDRNRYGTDGVPATLLYGGGVKYIVPVAEDGYWQRQKPRTCQAISGGHRTRNWRLRMYA